MSDTAYQVELYLLRVGDWVTGRDLSLVFGVSERELRRDGSRPGLCSEFAISHSRRGFKHVKCATTEEFEESYRRSRKHGISELVGARKRKRYRERLLTTPPPRPVFEVATGQAVVL
jgi:hypothetical protein